MPRADPIRVWYFLRGGSALGDTLVWTLAPVYFVRAVGMSPLQLVLVGTFMELTIFACEIPTGIVADVVSRRLSVVIGVPAGATALERRALLEAAEEAGIGRAHLLPEPVCGAVGCGIDPLQPRTHLVVDIGGGTSEVAAFGSGGMLTYRSSPLAGDEMTLALYHYIRHEHQLVVGELMAEQVKIRACTEPNPSMVVEGRDVATNRARVVNLAPEEVAEAVTPVTNEIFSTLAGCLEDLPPQSVSDVMGEGVVVVGGGSLIPGFGKRLEDAFGFSVLMAEDPLTRVAEGGARCLANRDALDAYAVS